MQLRPPGERGRVCSVTAASGATQVPALDLAYTVDDGPALRHADIHRRPDAAHKRAVVDALRAFLPAHCLLYVDEDTRPYECDGLTAYRQTPLCVVLPETEEQVRRTLVTCRELD